LQVSVAGSPSTTVSVSNILSDSNMLAAGCHMSSLVEVTTGATGLFELVVSDPNGIFDHQVFYSIAPTGLGIENAWTTPPLVLTGSTQGAHAITTGPNGEILRGSGAVQFTFDGTITAAPQPGSSPGVPALPTDVGSFTAVNAGTGHIHAQVLDVVEEADVAVVDPSAITDLVLTDMGSEDGGFRVSAKMTANDTVVHGVECSWSGDATSVDESSTNGLGNDTDVYVLSGPTGPFSATCTIPGGISRSIVLNAP
jgi:hypothetical protein